MLSRIDEKLWKTGWYIYYPLYILSLVGFNLVAPKYLLFFCNSKGLHKFIVIMEI